MSERGMLRSIHLVSTVWFIVCAGYVLILALRQAGVDWWVMFSLSGHSALVILLLTCLYLFAIFRGVSRSQKIEVEHPLTNTNYYMLLYVTAPFLGGVVGCLGTIGVNVVSQVLLGIALGTLGTTFLVWVVVDPAVGLLEVLLLPTSRKHRAERVAQAKAEREKRQKDRERLLAEVLAKEQLERLRWQEVLKPQAEKLAQLLTANRTDFKQAEREAIEIGLNAWRLGGVSCMQQLRDIAMVLSRQRKHNQAVVDYISVWWDGIGSWRNVSLG